MGTTYRFIESPLEQSQVIDWFRSGALEFQEIETKKGYVLYFESLGKLIHTGDGEIDVHNSPIYSFPSGLNALKKEQYFISDSESEFVVEKLCHLLKLRGVEVTT
jgi:hypothetical protein